MPHDPIDRDDLTASLGPVEHALDGESSRERPASDAGDPAENRTGRVAEQEPQTLDGDHEKPQGGGDPQASDGRVEALERRVSELEAELDSIRGLVDGVAAVDEAVERRASTALAKVEALERTVEDADGGLIRERLPADREREQRSAAEQSRADGSRRSGGPDRPSHTRNPEAQNGSQSDTTPGAISDVGSDARHSGGQNSTADDSLASRLRDAFR